MTRYVQRIPTPPTVLTEAEQAKLLRITGEHRRGYRDHILLSLAFGTALREHELVGLDVGDLLSDRGVVRPKIQLRIFKRSSAEPALQEIFLSETLRAKLTRFLHWKGQQGESLDPTAPLFVSKKKNRLSTRQVRNLFRAWQKKAGFERIYNAHAMRHSSCSNIYRRTKDIRLTQRFARHKSVLTTQRYAHPSTEDLIRAVQDLPC